MKSTALRRTSNENKFYDPCNGHPLSKINTAAPAAKDKRRTARDVTIFKTRRISSMRLSILPAALAAFVLSLAPARAEMLTVAQHQVADEKAVFATVESISVAPARGRISGTVAQLNVREGDRVAAGQVIATVGDEKLVLQMKSLDAQIEALQAQANQAQIDFTRIEGLVERGTLPRVKLDEARTALNVADNGLRARTAERAVISQQLSEGRVLAPSDGRVLKKLVTVGSVVLPGDAIVTVAQQHFKLRLRVPERHARFLQPGDKIRVDAAELGEEAPRTGVIDLVYPQIEEGRVIADATVEGLGEYFVGDRLRVWISAGTRPAFVIPASYVRTRFGIDYIQLRQADRTVEIRGAARP
ncbi:RND family efflux transporter MFP subunit [Bradyrhizobium elkanii]